MKTKRLYVGCLPACDGYKREVFRSAEKPTEESHRRFIYVIGPFRTRAGADWMADPTKGVNNPHCRCVADAERLAKKYRSV